MIQKPSNRNALPAEVCAGKFACHEHANTGERKAGIDDWARSKNACSCTSTTTTSLKISGTKDGYKLAWTQRRKAGGCNGNSSCKGLAQAARYLFSDNRDKKSRVRRTILEASCRTLGAVRSTTTWELADQKDACNGWLLFSSFKVSTARDRAVMKRLNRLHSSKTRHAPARKKSLGGRDENRTGEDRLCQEVLQW